MGGKSALPFVVVKDGADIGGWTAKRPTLAFEAARHLGFSGLRARPIMVFS
jgi:hypothetical protein